MRDKTFVVQISKLGLGLNHLNYKIDDAFFNLFPFSTIKQADLQVDLAFQKQDQLHVLDFHLSGWVGADCDICLESIHVPVDSHHGLLVKQTDDKKDEGSDDDLIIMGTKENDLDLTSQLYDYVYISLPIRKTCELAGKQCNPAMESIIQGKEQEQETDERWALLKKLKDKK